MKSFLALLENKKWHELTYAENKTHIICILGNKFIARIWKFVGLGIAKSHSTFTFSIFYV